MKNNKKKLNIGIIGCGNIFKKHINAIKNNPLAYCIGIYDIDENKSKECSEKYSVMFYGDINKLIDESDLVCVCTPHNTHIEIIKKILAKNKYCLCEKPGGLSYKEATLLCKNKNINKTYVVFQNRFNESILKMSKEIQKIQKTEKPSFVQIKTLWYRNTEYYSNSPWRGKQKMEGGILYNQGIHSIDILSMFIDLEKIKINYVQKYKILHKNIDTEDHIIAVCTLNETPISIEISTAIAPSNLENSIMFVYRKKRLHVRGISLNEFNESEALEKPTKSMDVYGEGHPLLIDAIIKKILFNKNNKNLVLYKDSIKNINFIEKVYSKVK